MTVTLEDPCRWRHCICGAELTIRDVTLLESGSFIGDVRVCRYHHRQAAATRHLDLDQKFMRMRMRMKMIAPPAKPELVVADVPWKPPTLNELAERVTVTIAAPPERPRRTRRRGVNGERGRWCVTDWDRRFDEGFSQFSAVKDGTGVSAVQNISGREIRPLPVTWFEERE